MVKSPTPLGGREYVERCKIMKKKKPKPDPFISSERHAIDVIKLDPWTPDRLIAFQSLGGIYPNISDEGWAALRRRSIYPGAVRDVLLALHLCSISPEKVLELETKGESEAKKESMAWGVKLGIHDTNKAPFWTAFDKFMQIQLEANQAITVPEKSEPNDDESGND